MTGKGLKTINFIYMKQLIEWIKSKFNRKPSLVKPSLVKPDVCECGEHSKCVRKIHSNNEGRLWVENEDHFKCGKVKEQVNGMLEWWNNYR